MTKNTTHRDLRFYMDTHSTPMYLSTKLRVNWPKYKGDRMSYILPFECKINFWQYDQKYTFQVCCSSGGVRVPYVTWSYTRNYKQNYNKKTMKKDNDKEC